MIAFPPSVLGTPLISSGLWEWMLKSPADRGWQLYEASIVACILSFFRTKGLISSLDCTVPYKGLFIYLEMIPNKIYLEGKSRKLRLWCNSVDSPCPPCSRKQMDIGAGEPGWDAEASTALPPRGAPPRLPVVPGERAPAPWPAGAPAVVTAGQGTALLLGSGVGLLCRSLLHRGWALTSSCFMVKQDAE